MYHSVTFGNKNTWDDWHLIPSTRPVFNPPSVKTQYIDIPGANSQVDLTESLTGYPVYDNRTGSMEFNVVNGYQTWDVLYSEIMNYLHGKKMKAYLEDDPYFYYEGRFTVNEWKSDKYWSIITIDYNVYPYKKEPNTSLEDWLWDPFDFEYGIIREYGGLTVAGSLSLEILGRAEPVVPTIIVDSADGSGMEVKVGSNTYHLNEGSNVNPNIVIGSGNVTLQFTGQGTVSVQYQGGSL